MITFTPTAEQQNAIDLVGTENRLKIQAFAGAAKSTTLAMIAQKYNVPSLYLTFNKVMADEAKKMFPQWVDCRTTHSLAFATIGKEISHKLNRPTGAYVNVCGTAREVARYFKIKAITLAPDVSIPAVAIGLAIKDTIDAFERSDDYEMNRSHVASINAQSQSGREAWELLKTNTDKLNEYYEFVLDCALHLWGLRSDPKSNILASHDTYLKLYQLSQPDLSKYQIIYLDEAQDTNDCVVDILMQQTNSKIVVVGDSRQAIYGWRGAINAMKKLPYPEASLSMSFRFGQPVADIANVVTGENMKGWHEKDSSVVDRTVFDTTKRHTVLYRTNFALVQDAVNLLASGITVGVEIDVRDLVNILNSAISLKNGDTDKVKHEFFIMYEDWDTFAEDAENSRGEINRIYELVRTGKVYEVLRTLRDYKRPLMPKVIMTTAHKSKGREWDNVLLANDFPSVYDKDGNFIDLSPEEKNLLYVAATRARKTLGVNKTLYDLVQITAPERAKSLIKSQIHSAVIDEGTGTTQLA